MRQSGINNEELKRMQIVLRPNGAGSVTNLPMQRGRFAVGAARWSQIRPGVLDLEIIDRKTVVPITIKDGIISYSEDPEFPTNLTFKKLPNQMPEPTAASGRDSS
jgi:hypothetical protein